MVQVGFAAAWLLASGPAHAQEGFGLLGTEAHELTVNLASAEECAGCHAGFPNAPNDMWEGTMMANAVIDPLYQAALTIANQDQPGSGEFCLRCHTPSGHLEGRLDPPDGSALIERDLEGVTCDLCHRLELPEDGPYIGNAQMVVADDAVRRGTIGSTHAPHQVAHSDFLSSSELCGTCHEVSNPGAEDFPIERTYSEWAASDFLTGESCQDCHMVAADGYASDPEGTDGLPERTLHTHVFVGGNTWIPEVLAGLYPELGLGPSYYMVADAARSLLEEAAVVMIETPSVARRGSTTRFGVRVENTTGHKIPTGYPEGRRMWLEVTVTGPGGEALLESGLYDHDVGDLVGDDQLRIYHAQLGNDGQLNYHMIKQDELLTDTRIPPRGFRPDQSMVPLGIEYEILDDGSYAHWDLAPYSMAIPSEQTGPLTVHARLWYQTTTRAYVEFLQSENYTDDNGDILMDAWLEYGMDTPELMAEFTSTLDVTDALSVDDDEALDKKGCLCAVGGGAAVPGSVLGLLLMSVRRRSPD